MIRSLTLRLAIGAVIGVAILLTAIAVTLSSMFTTYVSARYKDEMSVVANIIAANVSFENGRFKVEHSFSDPRFDLPAGGRYWQLSANGQPPVRSTSLWDTTITPEKIDKDIFYGFSEQESPDGSPMLIYAIRSTLAEGTGKGKEPFWIYCAFPKAELTEVLDGFHSQLRIMILLTAGFLIVAATVQNYVGLHVLKRLISQVADIRAGNTNSLSEGGPSEILPLVREINLLLSERETAIARARARASDLAHGLKTPLTVLLQLSQKLQGTDREIALKQVDLIRQRSDRQLQSARLGVEQMAATQIAEIAGKLVQVLKPATAHRKLRWHILIDPEMAIAADPADLAEAMGNVLDNAAKWAKSNILVRADQHGGWTDIRISDDGPGANPADYENMLRRGVFLAEHEDSSGLGLAISLDIASAYAGSLSLARSEMGGLEVTLTFPSFEGAKLSPA